MNCCKYYNKDEYQGLIVQQAPNILEKIYRYLVIDKFIACLSASLSSG